MSSATDPRAIGLLNPNRLTDSFRCSRSLNHRLDVYVWDYLTRRGFHGAAKTLVEEAPMSEPPDVPLRTPQGLLFE